MHRGLRATKIAGLPLALAGCACALALAPSAGARVSSHPAPDVHVCSTSGLSFKQKKGSFTVGVDVTKLRSSGLACAGARSLARTVAEDTLHERKVPHTVDGLTVKLKEPCAGCTPDWGVVAKSGAKLVTFTVRGGA